MQNVVETHKSGSDMELHHAVAMGQLEIVKFLVEKKHCNPMQKNHNVATRVQCPSHGSHYRKSPDTQVFYH